MEPADLYLLVADTLDRSADLAEAHAERDRAKGLFDPAEVASANRARAAARRARELASQFVPNPAAECSSRSSGVESTHGREARKG